MAKPIGFAVLFALVGLIAFALVAPLAFSGSDFRRIGAMAFPIVVLVAGGVGFLVGSRRRGKS